MILLQHGPFENWLADAGCEFEVLPMGRTRYLYRTAEIVARLRRHSKGASVVVANQSKGHAIAGTAALLARTPCVWWQHGIPGRTRIELAASAVPAATIVCSSGEARAAQLRRTSRRHVEVVYPGVDIDRLSRTKVHGDRIRAEQSWAGPVVGMVARLEPWKGQELFLRAAAQVTDTRPDVHFAVVGGAVLGWEGDYPKQLRQLADVLGISDKVLFAGHQDDVYSWFDCFDVAVTASVGEPFGLVTVEAMALGKPVIGVRSAGTADIVEDGISGLLVPPNSPDAMAAAILDVLVDRQLRTQLADGAKRRAKRFSDAEMTSKFARILDDVARDA